MERIGETLRETGRGNYRKAQRENFDWQVWEEREYLYNTVRSCSSTVVVWASRLQKRIEDRQGVRWTVITVGYTV